MTSLHKRFLMFLLGCIPMRLAIVIISMQMSKDLLPFLSIFAMVIALGFWIIFLGGYRKSGIETQGAPIWWNWLRPVHGIIWFLVAYYAMTLNQDRVWRLLLADTCLGLVSFALYHGLG